MYPDARAFRIADSNENLLHSAFFVEQVCIIIASQIALINLVSRMFVSIEHTHPLAFFSMRLSSAWAALFASAALLLLESHRSARARHIGRILGVGTVIVALSVLGIGVFKPWDIVSANQLTPSHIQLITSPAAFLLLGVVLLLIRAHDSVWSHIADGLASCLSFIVLILLSEFLFGLTHIPGSSVAGPAKIPTLATLCLLTLTIILRRAQYGVFSVFLSSGMDGRFTRILSPFLLLLPFLREFGRARLLDSHLVPGRYTTAILTSLATLVSFLLLLALSRLIHRMQTEIQQLNLRDELTGLYNFRGFNLFAEQAYRISQRAGLSFGVLFVDMDNLKIINDELGHSTGSVFLVETAKLLSAAFRETDVIGRLGGDEFVVAGQFRSDEMTIAIERIRSTAAARNNIAGNSAPLSLSLGYAMTETGSNEPLKAVIARADKAMYREKREKKRAQER